MDHHEQRSTPVIVVVLAVLLGCLLVVGGLIALGAGVFWLSYREMEIADGPFIDPQAFTVPVPVETPELPQDAEGAPTETESADSAAEKTPGGQQESRVPSSDEILRVAQGHVIERFLLGDASNVAWSVPEIFASGPDSFTVRGAFTSDGMSHRWSCQLRLSPTTGTPDATRWQCDSLLIDDESIPIR